MPGLRHHIPDYLLITDTGKDSVDDIAALADVLDIKRFAAVG